MASVASGVLRCTKRELFGIMGVIFFVKVRGPGEERAQKQSDTPAASWLTQSRREKGGKNPLD